MQLIDYQSIRFSDKMSLFLYADRGRLELPWRSVRTVIMSQHLSLSNISRTREAEAIAVQCVGQEPGTASEKK